MSLRSCLSYACCLVWASKMKPNSTRASAGDAGRQREYSRPFSLITVARLILCSFLSLRTERLLCGLLLFVVAQGITVAQSKPEEVVFPSGGRELHGFIWKPEGSGDGLQEESQINHRAKRARSSGCMATNLTPIPWWGWLVRTTARARTSPTGTSSNKWMNVPGSGGSGVRMYIPHSPRLSTEETNRLPAVCQAKIVPLGEEIRG